MHLLKPMRYESVAPDDVGRYLNDDRWVVEQKLDGVRCMVKAWDGKCQMYASTGGVLTRSSAGYWSKLDAALQPLADSGLDWVLDGELLENGTLWLFDAVVTPQTQPTDDFARRRLALVAIGDLLGWTTEKSVVRVVPQAVDVESKTELWQNVLDTHKEGVCLKLLTGAYKTVPGGRTRDVLKVKRTYTIDCIVTATQVGNKDSGEIAVYKDGVLLPIGKCTMAREDASVGDVVEVKFLYVNDLNKPRLFQPILLRRRTDKLAVDCDFDQLLNAHACRLVLA